MGDGEPGGLNDSTYVNYGSTVGSISIKWVKLFTTLLGAVAVFVGTLTAAVGQTIGRAINWTLAQAGSWIAGFFRELLTRSAGILGRSWTRAGTSLADRLGILAPWVAVIIVLAFATIIGFGVRMWYDG